MTQTMHAIQLAAGQRLCWQETARPSLLPGQLLIRVRAAAVNRADLLQRAGLYPPPPGASPILGLECSGEVVALAAGASRWRVGDKVCALLAGGAYAEYVAVDARHCLPVPAGLSLEEAAALPEAWATAYLNLFIEAGLRPGERVYLPAAASGVGTAAIQLCRYFGNPVWVSVGTQAKLEACRALGAEAGIVRGQGRPAELLGRLGADVILDAVGGAQSAAHLQLLNTDGRLVLIGIMAGREATLDLGRILVKRLRLIGSTLRSRSPEGKAQLVAALEAKVWPGFAAARLRPVVDRVFAISEAEAAHAHVAANANIGKVLLRLP